MNTRHVLEPDVVYRPRQGMGALHPSDEEVTQDVEWTDVIGPPSKEVLDEIKRLAETGQLKQYMPKPDALPVFALGFVGGALGSKLLKGTVGVVVGAGVTYWAWRRLGR